MDPDDGAMAAVTSDGPDWTAGVLEHVADGIAVIDAAGAFVGANTAAIRLCGLQADGVARTRSPFPVPRGPEDCGRERTTEWSPAPGVRREFSYVLSEVTGSARWAVSFRDVTVSRLRERRLAAIAQAASSVASKRSLSGTLDALAQEVARTDSLAGVQILTVNTAGDRLHMMGAAGFGREHDFFDKLVECRARGAELLTLAALDSGAAVVMPHRYDEVMRDPGWVPLHDYLRSPRWDAFVSVPLMARDAPVGILNAFFAPGQTVGDSELDFLLAIAAQAAMAVDHAALLEREGEVARREERQKLALDLHDSVVQQVCSMMMQARSLGVLVERGLPPGPERVAQVADELGTVAEDVLADLRGMVVERRPATAADRGLPAALRSLVDTTAVRTGIEMALDVQDPADELPTLDADLVEDVYRVIAEAVHNSVKHAGASRIDAYVSVTSGVPRRLVAEVTDDGRGLGAATGAETAGDVVSSGVGMTAMRERAARWGGVVQVRPVGTGGTRVRLSLPLATSLSRTATTPRTART
ncbi:GAF domain-containing protein [Geodermatophilus sp. CPCC 206100]|uniref:GAF domain-containing protein n=1 Tax=Geodermatophilus sp. CPCC 206100 TaxID=3020054 RepID=UPI003B001CE9